MIQTSENRSRQTDPNPKPDNSLNTAPKIYVVKQIIYFYNEKSNFAVK